LKIVLGLGASGVGFEWLRRNEMVGPVTLGQASFEVAASDSPTTKSPTTKSPMLLPDTITPVQFTVIPKTAWGATPVVGTFVEHQITRITVHHSGSLLQNNQNAPQRLRDHQAYHQTDQGWPDLAYHYVVDRNGHVYEGRPVWAVGDTGTDYDPTGHFLICCEGDFNNQAPTADQREAAAGLAAWASASLGVGLDTVMGHRDVASTSCPGDTLYAEMDQVVARAHRLFDGPGVDLLLLDDQSAVGLVADIESGRV
jgi:hypothetical protein